jgi:hypothetical protein
MDKEQFEKIFNYIKIFSLFSIFTGILYQYFGIQHNITFFSYSEALNDSISIIPYVLVIVLSFHFSYKYIKNYQ